LDSKVIAELLGKDWMLSPSFVHVRCSNLFSSGEMVRRRRAYLVREGSKHAPYEDTRLSCLQRRKENQRRRRNKMMMILLEAVKKGLFTIKGELASVAQQSQTNQHVHLRLIETLDK
jgi:hypothetical protein